MVNKKSYTPQDTSPSKSSKSNDVVDRLYQYQQQVQQKVLTQQEVKKLQELQQLSSTPKITQYQSNRQQNRSPIYKRVDQELKKKQEKLNQIKQRTNEEKKMKNKQNGVEEEEEIIQKLREKEQMAKQNYSTEKFNQKQQNYIRKQQEKQRNLKEQAQHQLHDKCTFKPNLISGSQTERASMDTSRVEQRLLDKDKQKKEKQKNLQEQTKPSFSPQINSVSKRLAKDKSILGQSANSKTLSNFLSLDQNNQEEQDSKDYSQTTEIQKVLAAFQ